MIFCLNNVAEILCDCKINFRYLSIFGLQMQYASIVWESIFYNLFSINF